MRHIPICGKKRKVIPGYFHNGDLYYYYYVTETEQKTEREREAKKMYYI